MKFIADRMLGRLSRWLRLLGYDTFEICKQENEDDILIELAEKEDRILISRDSLLVRRARKKGIKAFPVRSSEINGQLMEMHLEFNVSFEPEMNRCTLCNRTIRKIEPFEKEILKTKDYIHQERLDEGTEFWICENCGQVYWKGTHWKNIMERLNTLKKEIKGEA